MSTYAPTPPVRLTTGTLAAAAHPDLRPRLMIGESCSRPLSLEEETGAGTYAGCDSDLVIAQLEAAGLRGRGGSGFRTHIKWTAVATAAGPRVVVANGEEGEPSSFKDRWLLTRRPHAVLDGLVLAADVVGADRAVIYLSHGETVDAVRKALAEAPAGIASRVEVHVVEHSYVAGEETAVCRSINGGLALPVAKPPRPFESGVDRRPTLVSNVESLVQAAWIARNGAEQYRRYGTQDSPGTGLATLGGACRRPGVYEVPYGPSIRELITTCAGGTISRPPGLLMGGWFGGVARSEVLDAPWCYDRLPEVGSCLGCAAVTVLDAGDSVRAAAARLAAWYRVQTAGQCGVCVKGTAAIAAAFARLRAGEHRDEDISDLARWGIALRGRGACAFLDGAANLAHTAGELIAADQPSLQGRRAAT